MKLKEAIEKRADVKSFDLKTPNWRAVVRAIDAARFAPSAGNHFSARFIVIDDEKIIEKLADACQQSFVGKAKSVVVVVSDDKALVRSYGERGEMYGRQHSGAAIENFLLALEEEKLVTSWVWYFVDEQVRRVLSIPDNVKVEGIFPIGKMSKASKREDRVVKLEDVLFFGKYGEKKMVGVTKKSRDAI